MPWELREEFLRERVERGRRLLAESEEHRGTGDLQVRQALGCRWVALLGCRHACVLLPALTRG